jgi:hypothetical protein
MGRTISRMLMSGTFLVSVMMGANVEAQKVALPSTPSTTTPAGPAAHTAATHNPACQRIISECQKLGFIQGQWKKDNGLWKDCFDPVVKGGGSPTRDGKPVSVPVSASDIQTCRASESHQAAAKK